MLINKLLLIILDMKCEGYAQIFHRYGITQQQKRTKQNFTQFKVSESFFIKISIILLFSHLEYTDHLSDITNK